MIGPFCLVLVFIVGITFEGYCCRDKSVGNVAESTHDLETVDDVWTPGCA